MKGPVVKDQNGGELFEGFFNMAVLEGLGLLATILALLFIVFSSFRLFRSRDIPGAKPIFYSVAGTAFGIGLYFASYLLEDKGGGFLFETIIDLYLAAVFLVGAYGFRLLVNHVVRE